MVPIHVLAIAGSPRRHGNSEILLDWVIEGMKSDPLVHVNKVILNEADIQPCQGCNSCERLNRCIKHDGMEVLEKEIIDADCIILSAPIYCMGICAQAKALIDRAQVFRSRKYVLKLPVVPPGRKGKRLGVFISTAGQDWDYVFDAAIPTIKCFFHVIEVKDRDIHYFMVNQVDEKGAVLNHPTARNEVSDLSRLLVHTLQERLSG
ncbi:MAG: flavodoxin family protein [Methanospirillum sp.]|nr:flavodoxin family protein [Methanospirillum sp.]